MKRGGPLSQQSAKRISEREERIEVVRRAINAEAGRCGLWFMDDPRCRGELVGHELAHRSVFPGSHLIDGLVISLCVGHNGWEDVQVESVAESHGVRAPAWAVDQYGVDAVSIECRRIRWAMWRGAPPELPFWRVEEEAG